MYISRIYIRNYKSFNELDLFIHDGDPLTIIGRNGAGKSNLLNAVRLVLDHKIPHWEKQLLEADFCWHDSNEPWKKGEEIVITITFSGLRNDVEVRAFLDAIAGKPSMSEEEDSTSNSLEANLSFVFAPLIFNKKGQYDLVDDYIGFMVAGRYHPSGSYYTPGGEKKNFDDLVIKDLFHSPSVSKFYKYFYLAPEDLSKIANDPEATFEKKLMQANVGKAKRHLNVLFLDALRDVRKDFHYGYNSIVSQLIRSSARRAGELTMVNEVSDALKAIRDSSSIPNAKEAFEMIESRLSDDRANFMPNDTQLVLGTPAITLETIGKYYNFLVNLDNGTRKAEDLEVVGLGKQNLAYISSLFALFELKKEIFQEESNSTLKVIFNLLLIEEPESHLDVQNQKHLHTQIENKTSCLRNSISDSSLDSNSPDSFRAVTQVIQTSHSTHLTSKAELKNVVVIDIDGKHARAINIDSLLKKDLTSYHHNRRILRQYLDATRSSLLFARKVVLVEGLSEKYLLPTLISSILKSSKVENGTTSIDGEGIEIVEIGGKNFRPFEALYSSALGGSLSNKCLSLKDGDFSPEGVISVKLMREKFEELNKEIRNGNHTSNLASCTNVFTFEIDTYFLPDPSNPSANNVEYLKYILLKLHYDGQYYRKEGKINEKISRVDDMREKVVSESFNPKEIGRFFEDILYAEVSKPTLSLYLASLINAKETGEDSDLWSFDSTSTSDKGHFSLTNLNAFVFPEYLKMGVKWLITK